MLVAPKPFSKNVRRAPAMMTPRFAPDLPITAWLTMEGSLG
jgi:hypothetical protein